MLKSSENKGVEETGSPPTRRGSHGCGLEGNLEEREAENH